jgi:hypothetical protein
MAFLAKMDVAFGMERRIAAFASAAARLMRTFAMQVEVLRRLRSVGQQFVRVEHAPINEGGQAVIGNVKKSNTVSQRVITEPWVWAGFVNGRRSSSMGIATYFVSLA